MAQTPPSNGQGFPLFGVPLVSVSNNIGIGTVAFLNFLLSLYTRTGASQNAIQAGLNVGDIIPFAGAMVPASYLPCDGSIVSRQTYASLFTAIGVEYGFGDGLTSFQLPQIDPLSVSGTGPNIPYFIRAM